MEVELTNGYTYTIPDDVKRTCKYIKIKYIKLDDGLRYPSRADRRELVFQNNKELLMDYTCIGWENSRFNKSPYIDVEIHWFILTNKLDECQCNPTEQKVYKL